MKKIFAEFTLGFCIMFLLMFGFSESGVEVSFIKGFIVYLLIFTAKEAAKRL